MFMCSLKNIPILPIILSCLCKTAIIESVVFTDTNVSKVDVMSHLFMGALGPQDGSTAIDLENGVIVHEMVGNIDSNTVFEVQDKGRTLYLRNALSTVGLEGWTMPPQVYEAEDATINNAVSPSSGLYIKSR